MLKAGFFTGRTALAGGFPTACLSLAAGVEAFESDEEVEDAGGFPADEVVRMGAEFTRTGSDEGIGLPSFVWSFTTFPKRRKMTIKREFFTLFWLNKHLSLNLSNQSWFCADLLVFGSTNVGGIGVHSSAGHIA